LRHQLAADGLPAARSNADAALDSKSEFSECEATKGRDQVAYNLIHRFRSAAQLELVRAAALGIAHRTCPLFDSAVPAHEISSSSEVGGEVSQATC
jgi:hypothetical protein